MAYTVRRDNCPTKASWSSRHRRSNLRHPSSILPMTGIGKARNAAARRAIAVPPGRFGRSARHQLSRRSTGNDPLPGAAKAFVGAEIQVLMPLGGLIDPATEKARIDKEIGKCRKEIDGLEKKLGNEAFLSRAPEEVVAEIRQRLKDEQARLALLVDALEILGVVK